MKAMRHNITILSIAALTVFFSCNKMEEPDFIQNPDGSITVTASVSLSQTKALTSGGEKTFAEGEKLAVIYTNTSGNKAVAVSDELTTDDIKRSGKYAKFRVTFTDPDKTKSVTYVYPANMAKNDGNINYDALYSDQNGTLSKIASDFDLCTKVVSWSGSSLPEGQTLVNQLTVAQFTLRDSAIDGNPGNITSSLTGLTITNGSDEYSVSLSSNTTVWVAMKPITTGDIVFSATDGSNNYTKTVTSQTMSIGTLYSDITVSMNKVPSIPTGALNGKFTINASGDQVYFSQGNLQYQASTGTWRFATNQYDFVGDATVGNVYENETKCNNASIGGSYSGWIDLFGWGTGNNPTNSSTNNGDYSTCTDWGVNAISNGGNTADLWRTLSKDEWVYLFNTRTNAANLRTFATVNGVVGLILMPDGWTADGVSLTITTANYISNIISLANWNTLESQGCVFLPSAGYRGGTTLDLVQDHGSYWSNTAYNSNHAYYLDVKTNGLDPHYENNRYTGLSVRLVYETPFQGAGTESDPYLISSEADWIILANKVNSGNSFTGKFFRQTANINISTKCGTVSGDVQGNAFSGTFNGDGHTITATITDTYNQGTAPFCYIKDATIKNLNVAGTITGTLHAAAIVGFADATSSIVGCTATATVSGGSHIGGIMGHGLHGIITISGCVYSGLMAGGNSAKGAIVGWGNNDLRSTVTNCLYVMQDGQYTTELDLVRKWGDGGVVTVTNCYKTSNIGSYGQMAYACTQGAPGDLVTDYGLVKAYTNGILYNSTYYITSSK